MSGILREYFSSKSLHTLNFPSGVNAIHAMPGLDGHPPYRSGKDQRDPESFITEVWERRRERARKVNYADYEVGV